MIIPLIKGRFSAKEAIDIIAQLIHVKIRFHESKISTETNEEYLKVDKKQIKQLQQNLFEARKYIEQKGRAFVIKAEIEI